MKRRVGLLGGSFDPVHLAHLALARTALDALALDALAFVPAGKPWQKSRALAPAADRLAMLALAIGGEPRFVIERCELDRPGATYTVDTLIELTAREPDTAWTLVLGQDQWAAFDTWHRWPEVLALAAIAVAGRAGEAPRTPDAVAAHRPEVTLLTMPPMTVSSTDIRARAAAGASLDALVLPAVAGYIDRHALYRGTAVIPTRS